MTGTTREEALAESIAAFKTMRETAVAELRQASRQMVGSRWAAEQVKAIEWANRQLAKLRQDTPSR